MNKKVRNDDVTTLKEKGRLRNDEVEVAETSNSHDISMKKIWRRSRKTINQRK